jgi:hypothetical protein
VDELSKDARRLIDTAMTDDEPPSPDASWGALVVRLTGETPQAFRDAAHAGAATPKPRSSGRWIALCVVIAIAGLGGWALVRRTREESVSVPASAPVPARPRDRANVPPTPRVAKPPATPEPALERLLPEAETALARRDSARALELLERHAERAPLVDADRRMALRVLALCGLDRREDARAEARAFLAAHPESQWIDEVQTSCAGP